LLLGGKAANVSVNVSANAREYCNKIKLLNQFLNLLTRVLLASTGAEVFVLSKSSADKDFSFKYPVTPRGGNLLLLYLY
jgi:hypothetical protein